MSSPYNIDLGLRYVPFPKSSKDIMNLVNSTTGQITILAKVSKGIDLDFNPNGLYFGILQSPTGDIDELSFHSSRWNASNDYYADKQILSIETTISPIYGSALDWNIEDIDSYVLIES